MKYFVGTIFFLALLAISSVGMGATQDPTVENQPNPTNPVKPITPIPPTPPTNNNTLLDDTGSTNTGAGAGHMAEPQASANPVPSP